MFNTAKAAPLFEPLEPRLFLSGDVSVQIVKDTLVITGDDGANNLAITQSGFGQYVIKDTVDGTTRINGVPGGNDTPFVCNGGVKIDLKNGANQLTMDTITVGRVLFGSIVQADLSITAGTGGDLLDLTSIVARNFTMKLGDGSNAATVTMKAGVRSHFTGNVSITAGKHGDTVDLLGVQVGGNMKVNMGDAIVGKNEFNLDLPVGLGVNPEIHGLLSLAGGVGTNDTIISGAGFGNPGEVGGVAVNIIKGDISTFLLNDMNCSGGFKFRGGQGQDRVGVFRTTIRGPIDIQTNNGNDILSFSDVQVERTANIRLGADDDNLQVETNHSLDTNVTFHAALTVDFGAGNDSGEIGQAVSSAVEACVFYAPATFKGGSGTNTLICWPSATRWNVFNEVTFPGITLS